MYINYITTLRSNEETSRSYNKWTHEEELKLANEISQKKTLKEIALEHKRTLGAIKSRIISSIIYPEYIGCNMNVDELSEKYNIEKELIEKYIENKKEKIITNSIDIKFNYDNILLLLENNISSIEKKLDSICKIIDK